jgi:hypothetical protein
MVWWREFGVLELDVMFPVEVGLCHCQLVRLSKAHVLACFFILLINRIVSMSSADIIPFASDAVHTHVFRPR